MKNKHIEKLLLVLLFFIPTYFAFGATLESQLQDGDIIFQVSLSSQSQAIQKATHSKYSHMGIIFFKNGNPYVYEAIKTVQYTPLKNWISRGDRNHFVVKRLNEASLITPKSIIKLKQVASTFLGKPYDLTFEWSDDRIYCSELVWKIYERGLGISIGKLQKLKEFDLSSKIVKAKMKERYGKSVPLEEIVISPGAMFNAENLKFVLEQ